MIRVVLIGSGNLAFHLHKALLKAPELNLKQVVARRLEALADFEPDVPKTDLNGDIEDADIFLIAISDDAIGSLGSMLRERQALLVHTSGGVGLEVLGGSSRVGVLYPLQTFSRKRDVDMQTVPLCIEAREQSDLSLLRGLAEALSETVLELESEQRIHLHLSAVFINNFTNHMVYLGESICREQDLPEQLLHPLLKETWSKLENLSAIKAQTGPARRGDHTTMQAHRKLLLDPTLREVYQKISDSIQQTYD